MIELAVGIIISLAVIAASLLKDHPACLPETEKETE
jgi:hypothetical protein